MKVGDPESSAVEDVWRIHAAIVNPSVLMMSKPNNLVLMLLFSVVLKDMLRHILLEDR